jgi:4-amino-4-deoxy-L-arabinose transferase-like glycosyltransferase
MTAAPAMIPGPLGRFARTIAWVALGYWGLYALVAPVTTIDSQMYNLARVELAARGGLFNNDYFTSVFHVIFPWSYDAVHLPFLRLGWGYALPGFFCLIGICRVVFFLVRERYGADAAWVAVVSLLAMPCLAYQGSSTKNDIPILFCGAVWVYARSRWRREGRGMHLVWMVLSLGFMTGVKSSGLIYGGLLALATLWELRGRPELAGRAVAGLLGALLLFGSVETYVESARIYGHPLGPPQLIHRLRNHDGVRGGLANLVRHGAASVYVGPTHFGGGQDAAWALAGAARKALAALGLTDAGTDPRFPDHRLFFTQSGLEELSGYGPIGTLAVAVMLGACFYWRPRAPWWQLAVAALAGFGLVSMTVAYNSWTSRYLVSFYALGTVALVCALWAREDTWRRPLRWACLALAGASVVAAPLLSFNRQPADLLASLMEREQVETGTVPVIGKAREALRRLRALAPASRVYYVVSDESAVLPILADEQLDAVLVTPAVFRRLAEQGSLAPGDLVLQENEAPLPSLALVETVTAPNVFSENLTLTRWIYRVVAPAATGPAMLPAG